MSEWESRVERIEMGDDGRDNLTAIEAVSDRFHAEGWLTVGVVMSMETKAAYLVGERRRPVDAP